MPFSLPALHRARDIRGPVPASGGSTRGAYVSAADLAALEHAARDSSFLPRDRCTACCPADTARAGVAAGRAFESSPAPAGLRFRRLCLDEGLYSIGSARYILVFPPRGPEAMRKMLRNDQWERIEHLLPGRAGDRASRRRTTGCLLSCADLSIAGTGSPGGIFHRNWAIA